MGLIVTGSGRISQKVEGGGISVISIYGIRNRNRIRNDFLRRNGIRNRNDFDNGIRNRIEMEGSKWN